MRAFLILLSGLLVPGSAFAKEANSAPTTQMAPYRVQDFGFEMRSSVDRKTGEIRELKVANVVPGSSAAKAGLRDGDVLLSVDGTAVVGTKYTELPALFYRSVPSGQPVQYTFVVERGLLRKRATIAFEIKPKERKPETADRPHLPPT